MLLTYFSHLFNMEHWMGSGFSHVYHATRNRRPMANISYMNQRNQCQHIKDVGWLSSAAQIASYSNSGHARMPGESIICHINQINYEQHINRYAAHTCASDNRNWCIALDFKTRLPNKTEICITEISSVEFNNCIRHCYQRPLVNRLGIALNTQPCGIARGTT